MTKKAFTNLFNIYYKQGLKSSSIDSMHKITKLSVDLCTKLITNIWGCTDPDYFGQNIYQLLEASADSDGNIQFEPKLKTSSCCMYIIYPDEHAAVFALYKIKKYKHV